MKGAVRRGGVRSGEKGEGVRSGEKGGGEKGEG